jgi:DtxR family Mn-dependent transcriptional regulator
LVNPVTALIIFFILAALCFIFFIPKFGLWPLWLRIRSDRRKILIEDSLKFMYDSLLKKKGCTRNDFAEALSIRNSKLDDLIGMLTEMNLVCMDGDIISLTEEGKNYAIKIVRIHRLLEKYYAEETSIKENYWHIVANDREHSISDAEAESLSAKLGNPLTDPHGDPIPDKSGEHYEQESKLLSELANEDTGKIIHIEDEPPEKYSRILSLNLRLGDRVKIIGKEKNDIIIESEGKRIVLPDELAGNISVAIQDFQKEAQNVRRLSELRANEEAYIAGISKVIRGQQRRRLLDFGFVPGSKISVRLVSIGNDPIAYEIRNTTVALRRQQAEQVFIKDSLEGTDYGRN